MSFGELIFQLPNEEKQLIRKIEKLNKKLSKAESSLEFNGLCIK